MSHDLKRRQRPNLQQRMAGFEGLVIKAANGDVEPLLDQLRSSDDEDDRHLAWLLDRWRLEGRLPRPAHRPRRSLGSRQFALECVAYLVRIGKRKSYELRGSKIATKETPVDGLIKRAIELLNPLMQDWPTKTKKNEPKKTKKITVAEVRDYRRKPHPEIVDYLSEYYPAAIRAMIEEAEK